MTEGSCISPAACLDDFSPDYDSDCSDIDEQILRRCASQEDFAYSLRPFERQDLPCPCAAREGKVFADALARPPAEGEMSWSRDEMDPASSRDIYSLMTLPALRRHVAETCLTYRGPSTYTTLRKGDTEADALALAMSSWCTEESTEVTIQRKHAASRTTSSGEESLSHRVASTGAEKPADDLTRREA